MKYSPVLLAILLTTALQAGSLPLGYFQQEVKYDIDVKLDDKDHILRGHEKLLYMNNSPNSIDFIWMHLWPNAYKDNNTAFAKQMWENGRSKFYFSDEDDRGYIDSLNFTIKGVPLQVEAHPEWIDVVKLILPAPLAPGKRITIETPFKVKIPIVFSRLGHSGKHYEITQWYPKPAVYDMDGWHPMPYLNMGEFYSEFGTFDVKITIPEKYVVMGTGTILNGESEYAWLDSLAEEGNKLTLMPKSEIKKNSKKIKKEIAKRNKEEKKKEDSARRYKTLHFHQKNVHDFAWFADRDYIVQKGTLELPYNGKEVTLWSGFLPKNAELWKNSIEYLHDSGYWYSKFYGDYPYDHITAVDGDLSAGGGMEYPNITIISKMPSKDVLEMVIMHEVGHNWFYGILGSNERDHAWMDEGLNEFTNIWYWEKKYGLNAPMEVLPKKVHKFILKDASFRWLAAYLGYQGRTIAKDGQPIEMVSTDFYPSNYGSMIYSKTGIFTFYLMHYLGEEKFQKAMMDYYETFKFKHPQPRDFKAILNANLNEDLTWYLDDVYNTTKSVDYGIENISDNSVTISNGGDLEIPVELVYYDESGHEDSREWVPGFTGEKSFPLSQNISSVRIDPEDYLPDYDKSNNSSKSAGIQLNSFIDEPDFSKTYLGNIIPFARINAYNNAIGIKLWRGSFPIENFGYSVTPLWDLNNNTLIGSVKLNHNLYRVGKFDEINSITEVTRGEGRTSFNVGANFTLRKPIISEPFTRIYLKAHYHSFDQVSEFDPSLWNVTDDIFSASGKIRYFSKYSPILKSDSHIGFQYAKNDDDDHSSINAYTSINYQPLKKLNIKGELLYINVSENNIPQYSPYAGGSVDPDFEHIVWDRSGSGSFNMLQDQVLADGIGMRIAPAQYTPFDSGFEFSLTLSEFSTHFLLFLDYLNTDDVFDIDGKSYDDLVSLGLSLNLSMIQLYMPLYVNWDSDMNIGSKAWKDLIRVDITFDLNNINIRM
ncbi:MAG: M1 family metallopeptidase [Candidatus Marinimicrobia bacterium]|jgi:hypothetical protein|nr:M1 family metallopeptidase [Candidatus Neomarinimicrobiota bacterium]MBT3633188.1 M1 family metallopeptidase [Candidatus Neomarinimicrobiota bacterium]MBT3682211.1 M1 family metallopeptidase [Candidatus Neomarinimicrobiota bacterium]MBT3758788.1 M1 family metallopeptidase [Candidatus Neomarinimicrobiota bacterium]MBT3895338.1 M1 family metallopeptidase [Candidatus Neomarinimicrobiota bacterium]